MEHYHVPVMLNEVLEYLKPAPGMKYIDCTLGGGGYALAISKAVGSQGLVLGIDQDKKAIEYFTEIIKKQKIINIKTHHGNFKNLQSIVQEADGLKNIKYNGIVFDLGISSAQLEDRNRGISFKLDEAPLVMDFDSVGADESRTVEILNNSTEKELADIFYKYGEEKYSRQIARELVKQRTKTKTKIKKVGQLLEILTKAMPAGCRSKGKIHFATKIFQALRIATNDELKNLQLALEASLQVLKREARIVVISYHSLEDRIVKQFFKKESSECVCPPEKFICDCGHKKILNIITKKVVRPGPAEISKNPRARSAKLRAAEVII